MAARFRNFPLSVGDCPRLLFLVLFSLMLFFPQAVFAKAKYHFVHVAELRQMLLKKKPVLVFDVRSLYAYRMEHIPGALSLPLPDVRTRLLEDPPSKTKPIVTYCSCPHHLAQMAVDLLIKAGYRNAEVLDEGLPGWKEKGYPLVGLLANQPVTIYWVIGYATNGSRQPRAGVEVRIFQPSSLQLEIGNAGKDGFFAIPLRFYGLLPGDELQVSIGKDVIYFRTEEKADPWGIRMEDQDGRILLQPKLFLKTFREKKIHLP